MSKNEKASSIDYTNAITDSYNESSKALDTIDVSSLVPVRYGKIEVEYVQSGNGVGKVNVARYYSNGVYQETKVTCRSDVAGSAHKSMLNFIGKTPESLAGKSFLIDDGVGLVNVWFNVDFLNTKPENTASYRDLEVNILASHTAAAIASRLSQKMNSDSFFISLSNDVVVVISSSTVGNKRDTSDVSTSLQIRNVAGVDSNTLNNKMWTINSSNNSNKYFVWYNVDNSGTAPIIENRVGLEVHISKGYDSEQVAQATKNTLDSTGKFLTNISKDTLVITNSLIGPSDAAKEGNSDFIIFTTKDGKIRELLVTLLFEYNVNDKINSIERI